VTLLLVVNRVDRSTRKAPSDRASGAYSFPQLCEHGPAATQAAAHALQLAPSKVAGLHEGQAA
jgi:hypothetical protein